jgi:predicted P-loop ATPase
MSAAAAVDTVAITLWESLTNPRGRRLAADWNGVLDLPEWLSPPELHEKHAGRGWSPATFADDRRVKAGVESVCALVLDYEATEGQLPTDPSEAAALWGQVRGWLHTTYSHTPETPRFRVVVPLSRTVDAAEHAVLWRWAATRCAEAGHQIDESCRDASRFWFLPAVRPGRGAEYVMLPLDGEAWLDVDAVLQEQRAAEAPPPAPKRQARASQPDETGAARFVRKALDGALDDLRRAPKGTRHNTIRVKAYHLAAYIHTGAIDADTIERELMAVATAARWENLDKTRATVRHQIQAGSRMPKDIPPRQHPSRDEQPVPSSPRGSGSAPAPEAEAATDDESWHSLLISRRGEVTSDLANVATILEHESTWRGRLRLNEARQQIEVKIGADWRAWQDTDDTDGAIWLQRNWKLRVRPDAVCQAVALLAQRQRCNPLAVWLRSLRWDGVARIDTWLTTYAGAKDSTYTRAAGACWLRSAVARALVPGVKADAMLVLEGLQEAGKSSLFRVIGGDYFTDDVHDLASKDAVMAIARAWIVELPELSSLGRAEVELVKAFLSRQVDRIRPPYGRAIVELLRRCVFGGTTNRADYLKDDTGNRRFWPVAVGLVDLDALRRDREQLLAEAVASWDAGGLLYLPTEAREAHAEAVEGRRQEDPWESEVGRWLAGRTSVTSADVLGSALQIPTDRWTRGDQMRVGQVLARLGWRKRRVRVGADLEWRYLKGGDDVPT